MPTHPADTHRCRDLAHPRVGRAIPRVSEAGFTLVELMVVLVIVCILIGVSIPMFNGARQSSNIKAVVSSSAVYRAAIAQFRLDHANRVPILGSPDWPAATDDERRLGPRDMLGRPYLRNGIPRGGDGTLFDIGLGDKAGSKGRYVYEVGPGTPPTTFSLAIDVVRDGAWVRLCTLGNMPGASESCS